MIQLITTDENNENNMTRILASAAATLLLLCSASVAFAGSLGGADLALGMAVGSPGAPATTAHNSKLMEIIMNDQFEHDFELSIAAMNQLSAELSQFVQDEHMAEHVALQPNLMSAWAKSKGATQQMESIVSEFDFVLPTFWSKFKPLIERIVTERPSNLGPNDLDFRCRRTDELKALKEMSARSSLYSMYLDTFNSELHLHCLLRKLALIKNNHVAPSPLVKQFVDIYMDLPTSRQPSASKELQDQAAHQILAGQAFNFNLETARAQHGSLSVAADLVFDPRTALSMSPDANNLDKIVQEFQQDCQSHSAALSAIWGDFDTLTSYLSTQTSNLVDLNEKVKLAAPQLVYGSICVQLMKLID